MHDTASFVLGALVERLTKKELLDYLRENFLDKIGFSKDAYMPKCPGGHSRAVSGIIVKILQKCSAFIDKNPGKMV